MALKKKLDKAGFDALPGDFQKEYKAAGDMFVLDVEGDDGIDWKHKRDIEAEHRKNAETKATKALEDLDEMRRGAIPKNDVEALEGSWKTKLSETETKYKTELAARDEVIANTTVLSTSKDIASMFLAPDAMIPMIRSRLKPEITNGVAVTRVLDKNGQPSALSIEDLKNEFKADPSLKAVIVASKASGGGSGSGKDGAGGSATGGKKFADMGDKERTALYKENPDEFRRLAAAQNSTK